MKVKLTDANVDRPENLRGFKSGTLWDAKQEGFGLRVTRGGARTFVARFRLGTRTISRGKRAGQVVSHEIEAKIGSATEWTLDDARERAREMRKVASLGEDPRRILADRAAALQDEKTVTEVL